MTTKTQAAKKSAAKKAPARKKPADVCGYCGAPAVATRETPRGDRFLCTVHKGQQEKLGHETKALR